MNEDLEAAATSLARALETQARLRGIGLTERDVAEALAGADAAALFDVLSARFGLTVSTGRATGTPKAQAEAILRLKDGTYVVFLGMRRGYAILSDPASPGKMLTGLRAKDLWRSLDGEAISVQRSLDNVGEELGIRDAAGHWFWSRLLRERRAFAEILWGSFFANALAAVVSLFALQVYDRVIPNQSVETLWVLMSAVFVAIAFEAVLRLIRARIVDVTGRRIDIEASSDLLGRLMGLKLGKQVPEPAFLAQAMQDFSSLREFFTEAAVGVIADIPFSLLFLGLIYLIAGPAVWVPVAGIVIMCLPPLLFKTRMLELSREGARSRSVTGRVLQEVSYHMESVKSDRAAPFFSKQWIDIDRVTNETVARQRLLTSSLTQWSASVQQATYVAVVAVCVYLVFERDLSVGSIIAVSILTSRAMSPMVRLSSALLRWHNVRAALKNLDTIANSAQEIDARAPRLRRPAVHGELNVEQITYAYAVDSPPSLDLRTFDIARSEKLALLGNNGSGKSTFLKLLSGLYEPDGGAVLLDGLDIRQIDVRDLRSQIAYVPQEVSLFRGTLRENLAFLDPSVNDDTLLESLELAGLSEFLQTQPAGLDLKITDGGTGLSVGQKQCVGLARMFLANPRIALLDEPTASLDPDLEAKVIRNLRTWSADRTLVVATHRMPILDLTSRIAVLHRGRLVADGPRAEILAKLRKPAPQVGPVRAT